MSKAFTLIEVLMTSVLLCAFALAFTFLVSTAIGQIRSSRSLTRSVLAAKSMMEVLQAESFDKLFTYNNVKFDGGNGSITIVPNGSDMVFIRVTHGKVELNTARSRF